MIAKVFAGIIAIAGAAALTLGAIIALVQGTIYILAIENLSVRVLAVVGDVLVGTCLLVGCLYVATRLAVRIMGVGKTIWPPLPIQTPQDEPPSK